MKRALRKLDDYAKMGIPQIWLGDPDTHSCHRYTQGKLALATYFAALDDRVYFAMNEIEALLD